MAVPSSLEPARFLACWVTQAESGWALTPATRIPLGKESRSGH